MVVNALKLTSKKCYVKLQQHFSTKVLYCYLKCETAKPFSS